jgi:hypothetical protein
MYEKQLWEIKEIVRKIEEPSFTGNYYIAGGCMTSIFSGTKINDVDIYFEKAEEFTLFVEKNFKEAKKNPADTVFTPIEPRFASANALSYSKNDVYIQLIKKFHLPVLEMLGRFDFSVCMCAYNPRTGQFIMSENFLSHLSMRTVCYNVNSDSPINSLWRVKKYILKGFHFSAYELIKLALKIHSLKMETFADLKEQLDGIDTALLKEVTDTLLKNGKEKEKYELNEFMLIADKMLSARFEREHQ